MFESRRRLFRPDALAKLSSPERLDQLMSVVDPQGWLALAALAGLCALAGVWAVWGRIPSRVAGRGLVIRTAGTLELRAPKAGRLLAWQVRAGDLVCEGCPLGILWQGGERTEFRSARAGRVLELSAAQGQLVEEGDRLGSLEAEDAPARLTAMLYFPLPEGQRIEPGMRVTVTAERPRPGGAATVQAVVTQVTAEASKRRAAILIPDADTFEGLFAGGPKVEVTADLDGAADGARPLPPGAPVSARVLLAERAPISYLFPF